MANEFVIKNGYFSQGNSTVTGSLTVTQNVTASRALVSSSGNNQLTAIGSGSTFAIAQVFGSQGNLLSVTDSMSGSIFTISDISGYPILDITSDYYTGSIFLPTLLSQSQQNVVAYDSQSGRLYYMATSSMGGGGSGTGFPFTGSAGITGSIILTGSMFVSGTISASLGPDTVGFFGTASWAVSASNAVTASYFEGFKVKTGLVGDDSTTSFDITHNFGTKDLHVTIYESFSNYETVYPDIRRPDDDTIRIVFANPPSSTDKYAVYITS